MTENQGVETGGTVVGETNGLLPRLREFTTDAIRYWEIRRLFYNLLLAAVLLAHFIASWPASWSVVSFDAVLGIFLLAVLANVAYSAVYVLDVFIQLSGFRESRRTWRRAVLVVGFAFAAVITHFMSKGIVAGHGPN
jgi:hypothetical protein